MPDTKPLTHFCDTQGETKTARQKLGAITSVFRLSRPWLETGVAIRFYLNDNKVPQLLITTGSAMFGDPQHYPWTMGAIPNYQTEAHIFAKHNLATRARRENRRALSEQFVRQGLPDRAAADGLGVDHTGMVVKEASYEVTDPTVDFASRHSSGVWRRHAPDRRDSQSRRTNDPQGLRHRLEGGSLSEHSRQSAAGPKGYVRALARIVRPV